MKWKKLTIQTTTEALDYMGAIADELGLEGFEIEDNVPLTEEEKKSMFIDILPELPPDDGSAKVHFYIDEDADAAQIGEAIKQAAAEYAEFCDFGSMKVILSETEDKDWINNWKQFFKPFRADDDIVIKPTWTDVSELPDHKETDLIVEIDPGTAFGTGAHETTKLCIKGLKKYLNDNDKLLDVGCGSGILSIMGMKLGAESALGIDVDENASRTSVENCLINDIASSYIEDEEINALDIIPLEKDKVRFFTGNVLEDENICVKTGFDRFDVVVANILADIIIPLSKVTAKYMRKGALFISSGIINTKEEAVKAAVLEAGFGIVEVKRMNDWVSIIARKN